MKKKQCKQCKKELHKESFGCSSHNGESIYLNPYCKACAAKKSNEHYHNKPKHYTTRSALTKLNQCLVLLTAHRICTKCYKLLPAMGFYPSMAHCKKCQLLCTDLWAQNNRAKRNKTNKKYRQNHPDSETARAVARNELIKKTPGYYKQAHDKLKSDPKRHAWYRKRVLLRKMCRGTLLEPNDIPDEIYRTREEVRASRAYLNKLSQTQRRA